VALRWFSDSGELCRPLDALWRQHGGATAVSIFHAQADELGRPPWLLVDREERALMVGSPADVWAVIDQQHPRRCGARGARPT
jgi:hypothetical protein